MSFEYLADPSRPAWAGLLPGKPEAYFLANGEGERAKLFADTFSVLLSGDETDGQFGIFTATCPVGDMVSGHRVGAKIRGKVLVQAGNSVEFETYPGSDHMWRGAPAAAADALERTIDFLRRMLR